jgi:hypothetical protein
MDLLHGTLSMRPEGISEKRIVKKNVRSKGCCSNTRWEYCRMNRSLQYPRLKDEGGVICGSEGQNKRCHRCTY